MRPIPHGDMDRSKFSLYFCLLLISVTLVLLGSSCMKHSCYECTDETGTVLNEGCDKTREEVKEFAETTGRNCIILPD